MGAGLRLVGKRIERRFKEAEQRKKLPRRPSAAEIMRRYKLAKAIADKNESH